MHWAKSATGKHVYTFERALLDHEYTLTIYLDHLFSASFFEWFSEEAKRLYGEVIPSPNRQQRMIAIRQPLGVVGIITPWSTFF